MSLDKYKAKAQDAACSRGKIEAIECEADACTVNMSVTYDHPDDEGDHHADRPKRG